MPKIVVTQPIHPQVLRTLQAHGEVVVNPGPEPWPAAVLLQHLADADAMMAFMPDKVDRETLAHAPRLKTIACALKGYDNFDLAACADAGVVVSFVPDLLTEPTAELAIGLAIATARNLLQGDRLMRQGRYAGWRPILYGVGLRGATVAVVGLGAVGRAIVDRLQGFDCAEILGVDPLATDARVVQTSLRDAVARADFVLLAVPLVNTSVHLVNGALLQQAKPGQIVVNVGRGSVVDEAAMAQALRAGQIAGYAADVYEMEDWLLSARPAQVHPDL
ncbi:MAG: NAD(P)-dependent oxidoreductase, partial [Pseudomonadota bacterium]